MKYEILGFSQPRAVELGLTSDDLLVLRWFVDFRDTGRMKPHTFEDGVYYWVSYDKVLEDLPVLKIQKQALYRKRFGTLCSSQVLKRRQLKTSGTYSYYCYGLNYETLIYLQGGKTNQENTSEEIASVQKYSYELYGNTFGNCTKRQTKDISISNIKRKKADERTFDQIINDYTFDTELRKNLVEFIKTRTKKRNAPTNHALDLLLKDLDNLSGGKIELKNQIVEKSIKRGWLGFFALDDKNHLSSEITPLMYSNGEEF